MNEAWNYDTGQNPWPLNPSLAFGLMAVELTKPRLAMSTVVGVQFKLPIFETPNQPATSVASGLFWEKDLQESRADRGNRFLLTFGANVFSLFAGK